MNNNKSKLIAPIIITCVLVLWLLGYLFWCFIPIIPLFIRLFILIISLGLIGVSIFVLYERIKEIRSGEEDDLSKY